MAGMERFTIRAKNVLSLAHQEAERAHHSLIGNEHLLMGLVREEGGVAGNILREMGLDVARIRETVNGLSSEGSAVAPEKIELSQETKQVLEFAVEEAHRLGNRYIGTEHLLLGLINSKGNILEILRHFNITPDDIRRQLSQILQEVPSSNMPPVQAGETNLQPIKLSDVQRVADPPAKYLLLLFGSPGPENPKAEVEEIIPLLQREQGLILARDCKIRTMLEQATNVDLDECAEVIMGMLVWLKEQGEESSKFDIVRVGVYSATRYKYFQAGWAVPASAKETQKREQTLSQIDDALQKAREEIRQMTSQRHNQIKILNQGVTAWNQWRKENPEEKILLWGVISRGANLRFVNLQGAKLGDANLENADLEGSNLQGANLENANLSGANLQRAMLGSANLCSANLAGANLKEAFLTETDLSTARGLTQQQINSVRSVDYAKLPPNIKGRQ